MWDLIVSVPDHCLSFYFSYNNLRGGQNPDIGNILKILKYRPLRSQKEKQP